MIAPQVPDMLCNYYVHTNCHAPCPYSDTTFAVIMLHQYSCCNTKLSAIVFSTHILPVLQWQIALSAIEIRYVSLWFVHL